MVAVGVVSGFDDDRILPAIAELDAGDEAAGSRRVEVNSVIAESAEIPMLAFVEVELIGVLVVPLPSSTGVPRSAANPRPSRLSLVTF